MKGFVLIALILFIASPVFAGDKQSPKVYTEEDLSKYRHSPDAVLPEGFETMEQYRERKNQEEAQEDAFYSKQVVEVDRACREEIRHREQLQQQEDIREEIAILKGNLAVQKYGDYPGVKVARDLTRERFSPKKFYYECIKNSGIPPKYFGFDRWE